MANDNYYKSQDSDFFKEIKCNNINSNFNGVDDNIGTDDGLLGVGDTSLQGGDEDSANGLGDGERTSNRNFDVDCIYNNDNEGGQGTTGPPDPPGSGATRLDDTNTYQVTVDSTPTSVPFESFANPSCDPGDLAISGGFTTDAVLTVTYIPYIVGRDEISPDSNSWAVHLVGESVSVPFTARVLCFDNPPPH
jgi:hypothetical protein